MGGSSRRGLKRGGESNPAARKNRIKSSVGSSPEERGGERTKTAPEKVGRSRTQEGVVIVDWNKSMSAVQESGQGCSQRCVVTETLDSKSWCKTRATVKRTTVSPTPPPPPPKKKKKEKKGVQGSEKEIYSENEHKNEKRTDTRKNRKIHSGCFPVRRG